MVKKKIIGGIITLVIGGTGFTISQTDVVSNFAKETGMSQLQAQQYADNAKKNLETFTKIGQELTSDGNSVLDLSAKLDCANYTYDWETDSLNCNEGQNELRTIGNHEVRLGNCYTALGGDLGSAAKSAISECIDDIDTVDADYEQPIAIKLLDSKQVTDMKNGNLYNKSVLKTALESR